MFINYEILVHVTFILYFLFFILKIGVWHLAVNFNQFSFIKSVRYMPVYTEYDFKYHLKYISGTRKLFKDIYRDL